MHRSLNSRSFGKPQFIYSKTSLEKVASKCRAHFVFSRREGSLLANECNSHILHIKMSQLFQKPTCFIPRSEEIRYGVPRKHMTVNLHTSSFLFAGRTSRLFVHFPSIFPVPLVLIRRRKEATNVKNGIVFILSVAQVMQFHFFVNLFIQLFFASLQAPKGKEKGKKSEKVKQNALSSRIIIFWVRRFSPKKSGKN